MSVPPPPPHTASMAWHAAPFTVAQWQELEHQALIFKYLKAGLSVPPDLLAPIRRSLQLMSPKLPQYQTLGYYGKKTDPEPGRCRRTDGKKWRCARDAHPDSKYCDRHMIRRRYRSRKPVESSQSQQQSHSSSASTAATTAAAGSGAGGGVAASASSGTFHALPLHTNGSREGFTLVGNSNSSNNSNSSLQHLQMGPMSLPGDVSKKEFRFALNSEADEHDFLQKDLGTVRYQGYDFTSDGMWSMPHIPSSTVSESRTSSTMVGNYFEQRAMRDTELLNLDAARTKELVFGGHQLSSAGCLKQEYPSPQSLFTDWHWGKKDLGSDAVEYRPSKDFSSDANC